MQISISVKEGIALFSDKLHEECAVFGASLITNEAAGLTYNGLFAMQHRGQEGAGIAVLSGSSIVCRKNVGLVSEVFSHEVLGELPPSGLAIGHARYSTTGATLSSVQPFVTDYLTGRVATAHNGNIMNAAELRDMLSSYGLDFSAQSENEVISSLVAYKAMKAGSIEQGVIEAVKEIRGAFSIVVISSEGKLVAARDPHGFRPLCIGMNETGIIVASESCALDGCGFSFVRDIAPGEVITIENGVITDSVIIRNGQKHGICIFEYVYVARPDSVIDGQSVFEARYNMGRQLAREYPIDADIVCGVPDSGLEAAMGYAAESGKPYMPGFVKNRYIGRSFIYPMQSQREDAVAIKLTPLRATVEGKRIILIDDSIVRGTTSKKIVRALREAGAKEVHMLLSSPPFVNTCYFGIDIGDPKNLIANRMDLEGIRKDIDADSLGFISCEGLVKSCDKCTIDFCLGCFNGQYSADVSGYDITAGEGK